MSHIFVTVINPTAGPVIVQARLEADVDADAPALGDVQDELYPGDTFGKLSFEQLVSLGDGEHEVEA